MEPTNPWAAFDNTKKTPTVAQAKEIVFGPEQDDDRDYSRQDREIEAAEQRRRKSYNKTISNLLAAEEQKPVRLPRFTTDQYLAKFITVSPEMLKLKEIVRKLASTKVQAPVLITGETGTGKEIIANALHGDRPGNFVDINCGGFPEHLVDSELFGHLQGSFTGADSDKLGLFEAAQDGTIFLDEIGELPLLMQVKLLRVIQEHKGRRVGSIKSYHTNARVVCATHRNLKDLIEQKKFREDLYWRLSTFVVEVSPLRKRQEDVVEYLKVYAPEVTVDLNNNFDGNYRELQQIIDRRKVLGI